MGICLTLHFLFKHFLKLYRPAMDPLGSPCTPWVWYLPVVTLIPSSDRPSPRLFICLFIQDSSLPEGLISFKFPECLLVSLVSVSELLEFQDCLSHLSIPYLAQFQNHHMFKLGRNHVVKCLALIVSLLGHKCVSSPRKARYRNLGISNLCIRNHVVRSLQWQQVSCPFPQALY